MNYEVKLLIFKKKKKNWYDTTVTNVTNTNPKA